MAVTVLDVTWALLAFMSIVGDPVLDMEGGPGPFSSRASWHVQYMRAYGGARKRVMNVQFPTKMATETVYGDPYRELRPPNAASLAGKPCIQPMEDRKNLWDLPLKGRFDANHGKAGEDQDESHGGRECDVFTQEQGRGGEADHRHAQAADG